MDPLAPVGCIILAGGASARLGHDKRRLRLWGPSGPTLLEHTVALAGSLCAELVVVLNDQADWADLPARLVPDPLPGAGPLGGLAGGLAALRCPYALLLACDMPLIAPELLRALLAWPRPYDALVPLRPSAADGPRNRLAAEPLLAVYRVGCLPTIQRCLARGERRMTAALDQLQTVYVPPEIWRRYDPAGRSFLNINRAADVAQAHALIGGPPPDEERHGPS